MEKPPLFKQFKSVEDALESYDRSVHQNHLAKATQEREEMQRRFPLDAWPSLPLEQYALGQPNSSDTYCR